MNAPTPVIEVQNLSKYFGNVIALHGISMKVHAGEVMCLLGDNGAGKSTLIKTLFGVHPPSEGNMLLDGKEVLFTSPGDALGRGIATVFQDLAMIPLMSVTRNFFMGRDPVKGAGPFKSVDWHTADTVAKEEMAKIGIDDSGSKTGLAFTEMKPEDCALVMYRNNAADLLIRPEDVREDYIRRAKALVISGTALCRSPSRDAVFLALMYAREHATVVIFDVDYRPYSWDSPEEVSIYCGLAAEKCDVIIGTREELDAMEYALDPGNVDDAVSARRWFEHNARIVVIKHGKDGSFAYTREGEVYRGGIFPVELVKPFGAGDAFASAFSHSLLQGHDIAACLEAGTASASIVISRDSCTEAMPTVREIQAFITAHTS